MDWSRFKTRKWERYIKNSYELTIGKRPLGKLRTELLNNIKGDLEVVTSRLGEAESVASH